MEKKADDVKYTWCYERKKFYLINNKTGFVYLEVVAKWEIKHNNDFKLKEDLINIEKVENKIIFSIDKRIEKIG